MLALERRGLDLVLFSLVRSGEDVVQPQVADVRAPVHYLDGTRGGADVRRLLSWFAIAPMRTFLVLVHCLLHPRMAARYGECSTRQCLGHALRIAATIVDLRAAGDEPVRVHAHFAHDPALVGMLVARLTGLPFSFTAHARDLYELPGAGLIARAREATAVVTCCEVNARHLESVVPHQDRPPIVVVHHGVDLQRFSPASPADATPPLLVSVGRLVEKKGFTDLLRALREMKHRGVPFHARISGDGPLYGELARLRDTLGLTTDVELGGAEDSDAVLAALHRGSVFALTPRELPRGDGTGSRTYWSRRRPVASRS